MLDNFLKKPVLCQGFKILEVIKRLMTKPICCTYSFQDFQDIDGQV